MSKENIIIEIQSDGNIAIDMNLSEENFVEKLFKAHSSLSAIIAENLKLNEKEEIVNFFKQSIQNGFKMAEIPDIDSKWMNSNMPQKTEDNK